MLTIDALRAWGANVDEGLTRCCGNEAFYLRLAGMAAQDGNFARLEEALGTGDVSEGVFPLSGQILLPLGPEYRVIAVYPGHYYVNHGA